MKKALYIILSLVAVHFISQGYIKKYNHPKPVVPKKAPKSIHQVGKKKMVFYFGGISGGKAHNKANLHKGDKYINVYFDLIISADGTPRLLNIQYDQPDNWKLAKGDIHTIIRLDAAVNFQGGEDMRRKLQKTLDSKFYYSLEDGYEYGLKKYVEYLRRKHQRPAGLIEHLVTMKDNETPLRLLEVTHSPAFGETAGGVRHYFMYNDFVQVKIHYRKIYLKDWQRIETSVRSYIDKLYAEAKQHDILYYSDTSNAITRNCP